MSFTFPFFNQLDHSVIADFAIEMTTQTTALLRDWLVQRIECLKQFFMAFRRCSHSNGGNNQVHLIPRALDRLIKYETVYMGKHQATLITIAESL